ncbi:hypothetical protein CXF72_11245 [Psychromonas sp. MB-3u-54]|uniref:hypothetical protein n=1 Tax=Psychromonas sp. MB-3u-54 TaxID=2058319 RepID=UPI000C344626|nr:hypothetical protein [Psychromonas sp. MB-3u-54]PKH02517.1 hypothetical protein CXF72_11245 [Psychromonas sp. MB-3u-54]
MKSNASILDVIEAVDQDMSNIEQHFVETKDALEEEYNNVLSEKTILGKYNKAAEKKVITFKKDTKIDNCFLISELANELYSEIKHTLTIPIIREIKAFRSGDTEFVGNESGDVSIELSMADIFANYCKTLSIKTDLEEVQICGKSLLSIKNENLSDSDIDRVQDVFECYQLFNQGLLLNHDYDIGDDRLTYIYPADNGDELLLEIKECMVRHNWNASYQATCLESIKIKLLESGYRLASIRSIY